MAPYTRNWIFTINNWTPNDEQTLIDFGGSNQCKYLVYGYETGASGTPHLQGYVIFRDQKRLRGAKNLIGPRSHLEPARGSAQSNYDYCTKDGLFKEFGELPKTTSSNGFDALKQWVLNHPSKPTAAEVALEWPGLFIRYGRIMQWIDSIYPAPILQEGEPRPWQRELAETLERPSHDRKIIFVVDRLGGCGKSWFVRWWFTKYANLTQRLSIGKRDDLAYAIEEHKLYFFFDIPRAQHELIQYSILEQLKDRMVFSPKYCSRTKVFHTIPHVVVFMNEDPNFNELTNDRYEVIYPFL